MVNNMTTYESTLLFAGVCDAPHIVITLDFRRSVWVVIETCSKARRNHVASGRAFAFAFLTPNFSGPIRFR